MYSLRLLLDIMPFVLVEFGGIPWTGCVDAELPMDSGFQR